MAVFSNFISGNDNKFLLLYNIRPMGALIHWFFIGYWINTGSDFHLGPFLFLTIPGKPAGFHPAHYLISPLLHIFIKK